MYDITVDFVKLIGNRNFRSLEH